MATFQLRRIGRDRDFQVPVHYIMPSKRPHDAELADAIQSCGINMEKILASDMDHLTLVIAEIVHQRKLAFKKAKTEHPSFSNANWNTLASQHHLVEDFDCLSLSKFSTPVYTLPPSFHASTYENSWRALDVYREKEQQKREAARVRILDPYIMPILALFQGRIMDTPEANMPGTSSTSGGQVEHEIIMIGGILFVVIEAKLGPLDKDNVAQLFLELLSAAKLNSDREFKKLRVYGLLTNLNLFSFYSYDPVEENFFEDDAEILIDNRRSKFLSDMVFITNKIFGLVLHAFVNGLRAILERSRDRATKKDFSSSHSHEQNSRSNDSISERVPGKKARKSTDNWQKALTLAEQCCVKFENIPKTPALNETAASFAERIEAMATEALNLLSQSVRSMPRCSKFTGDDEDPTPAELKRVAYSTVEKVLFRGGGTRIIS